MIDTAKEPDLLSKKHFQFLNYSISFDKLQNDCTPNRLFVSFLAGSSPK